MVTSRGSILAGGVPVFGWKDPSDRQGNRRSLARKAELGPQQPRPSEPVFSDVASGKCLSAKHDYFFPQPTELEKGIF